MKEFFRKHLLKILLGFIVLQLGIFALVQNLNHRPKAVADKLELIEGRSGKISPLANDEDKDEKDILELSTVSEPKHGKVKQKGGILFYTPEASFTGDDSLTYTATDGKKESKPATIVFQVIKNQAPIAIEDKAIVYSGGTAIIYALDNDEDKEKDSIFIKETTQPLFGTVSLSGNMFFYNATRADVTSDSFYYTASDGRNLSKQAKVKVQIRPKNDPCFPWLISDIGDVARPGTVTCANGTMKVKASGTDIWNNADGFYFIYQLVSGNCEISAKVESLEGAHEWTKSGLMIRENLSAGSKNAFIGMTTTHGVTSQMRPETRESSENIQGIDSLKTPYWIKLSREADSCRFSVSPDGISWKKLQSKAVAFPTDVYLGMAITSHDNSAYCKTELSHYKVNGKTVVIKKP